MTGKEPPVLIPEEEVRRRVGEISREVSSDYAESEDLVLVGILRGCFIFLADLARLLTVPRSVDFMALAAYGHRGGEPGPVRLIMDLRTNIGGKDVLIVEDIVDTGNTLDYLVQILRPRGPASLRTCVLLRKKDRLEKPVTVDYLGFDIPDVWVVGYGLDCGDRHRALPYIGVVDPG
ncbi:MAG TPA: hypoxanthine phosphoribosyltransferase [Candidatus Aquicultoraceae bacterium]|nr:hypoxanthine phosphoribosyltransferase [Candidatus Aquicultoraceae bacterium]